MYAAINGHITTLPPQWEHDPTLQDDTGWTVAMYVANHGDINTLPPQWEHSPTIGNKIGRTVTMIANLNNSDVPE